MIEGQEGATCQRRSCWGDDCKAEAGRRLWRNSQGKEGPDYGRVANVGKGPAGKVTGSKEACVAGKGLRS